MVKVEDMLENVKPVGIQTGSYHPSIFIRKKVPTAQVIMQEDLKARY